MNQRLTRREIKRDEFATAMGRSVEYAESHWRTIAMAVGGVVLLVLLLLGVRAFLSHRATASNEALAQAMKVYQAPIDAAAPKPQDPKSPSFRDEASRQARAKELFTQVRDDHGSTDAADVAGVYLADLAAAEGQLDRARELWQDFLDDHKGHMLAGPVRLNLYALDRKQGKGEPVLLELRGMVDQADAPLPQDVVLHELGVTLEQLGRGQEAIQHYRKILDEYPQSPYRSSAQQRLSALDPSSAGGGAMPMTLPGFPG
jgi:predicted negative regulator of RcsB-dependent stress response